MSHFGAGSIVSPVVHSRYEHTIGVWKLTAHFFPNDKLARAAAILHDIGHLPFSHSIERTFGFNHHELTEKYLKDNEIEEILDKADLTCLEVIDFLNSQNQITGTDEIIGLDHLDSFFRDTYMNGGIDRLPKDLLSSLSCSKTGVIANDYETALYVMELILMDHELFLSPQLLAADRILAEAISLHFKGIVDSDIAFLTDFELLTLLNNSSNSTVKDLMNLLMNNPSKINIQSSITGDGISFGVRKIYNKTPMLDGKPLSEDLKVKNILEKLGELKREYELIVNDNY
ncbi:MULTISPECIES: HD domain-containing protein [Clostridia]|uniref:HD domain-containing protein n=1 Tax=Clostridia TaxID=186801 RepID=UPI001313DF01|nr:MULTISPECIES: HD domain-containing protein [Clostridia]